MALFSALLLTIQALVLAGLSYHALLLFAGQRRSLSGTLSRAPTTRFTLVLPAHNEEAVIAGSVTRLLAMDYPADLFRVHVVADYCSDRTADTARRAGAIAHERQDGPRGRKGYALGWMFTRLLAGADEAGGGRPDAIVVFDADSRVAPDFLRRMDTALAAGHSVIQGRHVIANPEASNFTALADADMRINNRIRNQAKVNLGLSARLMGDAMCFRRETFEHYSWDQATSLTEDREYGIYLVTHGQRVAYDPDAVSVGQATARWNDASTQRLRWYGGIFDLQQRYVPRLLAAALHARNRAALDLAFELSLPSFSVLALLAAASALLSFLGHALGLAARPFVWAGGLLVVAAVAYPFAGLALERAPSRAYRALLHGPLYVAWRVWIALHVQARQGQVSWVRTHHSEESAQP